MPIIKGEIDAQFDALARTLEYLREREAEVRAFFAGAEKIVIFGCGSSFSVAKGYALQFSGIASVPATALPAGDYLVNSGAYANLIKGAVIVSISRSGSTSELVEAARHALNAGAAGLLSVCAATDAPISPLASLNLEMPWCFDRAVCQTRTVNNFYAAGLCMACACGGDEATLAQLSRAPDYFADFSKTHEASLAAFARRPWTHAAVLADGYAAGLAEEGALAFKEICRLPSNHYHLLDLRHGPMVLVNKETLVVAFLSDGEQKLQHDLLADVRKKGPHILALPCNDTAPVPAADLTIPMPGGFSAPVAAFYLLYCIHLLTYEKALARGVDPDRPEGLDPWIKLG